jgi:hypothetical protein
MPNDLVPSEVDQPRGLASRVKGALKPVAATLGPGALVGAIYLASGTHWMAFKATIAGWGIPAGATVFAAPLVAVAAVLGVRYLVRLMRDGDEAS